MSGAHVGSIDAVRQFRAELHTFAHEVRQAIDSYDQQVRRALEWLLETQPQHWQQEVRKCDEAILEAKIELERCRLTRLPGGGTPSCMEEKKALERARQRRQFVEEKVASTRKWGYLAEHEADEYSGRATQLAGLLDGELPRAIGELDRALTALESYAALDFQRDPSLLGPQRAATSESVARPLDAGPALEQKSPKDAVHADVPESDITPRSSGP